MVELILLYKTFSPLDLANHLVILTHNFATAFAALKAARYPEQIFGPDPAETESGFREWAKLVHEDKVDELLKADAHIAFLLLTKWYEEAEKKILRGTYGNNRPSVIATLKTKTATYNLTNLLLEQDIACVYEGESAGKPVLVKVCRSPSNNDLMKAEADLLAKLPAELDPKHTAYFPNLLDSFEIQQGKAKVRINVFSFIEGAVSLTEVRRAYPDGIDIKDAAWMWNRMLEAAHLLHVQGYVHANIVPDNFWIVPSTHQGILVDFCFSRKVGQPAKAISKNWKDFYPAELLLKKPLDFGGDVCMIASCFNHLIGGTGHRIPAGTPVAIAGLLRACWLGPAHRTNSASQFHKDFKEVRKGLGWKKEFRPFTMTS